MNRRKTYSYSESDDDTSTLKNSQVSSTSDYSDDFEHDSRRSTPKARPRKRNDKHESKSRNPYASDKSTTSNLHSSAQSKKSTQSVGRRGHTRNPHRPIRGKQGWRSHSFSKETITRKSPRDVIQTRMLSAKQHKINETRNELYEANQRLDELRKENRLLKTLQRRQDNALRHFENAENDLPRLIAQNSEDQRVLKARLRKAKEAERALESKLRDNNDEMQKMEGLLKKLKSIVYNKNLGERDELSRQLDQAESSLTVAERKIKELDKKLELTVSSFTRQINSERLKHKDTKDKLEVLHEDYLNVKTKLKEKERALDVSNIYSLRKKDSPEKALVLSSVRGSPRATENLASSGTQTDMAIMPRSVSPDRSDPAINRHIEQNHIHHRSRNEREEQKSSEFRKTIRTPSPSMLKLTTATNAELSNRPNEFHLNDTPKKSSIQSSSKSSVFLTANFESPLSSQNGSFINDSTKVFPNVKYTEQDSLETSPTKSDELNAELEEARKKQVLEVERRKAEEDRQKRLELLAKLREVEQDKSDMQPLDISNPGSTPVKAPLDPKSKAKFVKSLLGNDNDPVVENLHLGLPSYNGTKKKDNVQQPEREISFGSYAPTVGGIPTRKKAPLTKTSNTVNSDSDNDEPLFDLNSGKQNKKSDLLTQLFGDQTKSSARTSSNLNNKPDNLLNVENEGLFNSSSRENLNTTPRAKPVHSSYPWEKNISTSAKQQGNGDSSTMHKYVSSKPMVTAIPSFNDDEIEELVL